jgi:ribose transport system permease protein
MSGAAGTRLPVGRGAVGRRVGQVALRLVSNHSLLLLLIALIALFSALKPDTFPTELTLQGILSSKTAVVMLALGLMFPLTTNNFDLSIGYVVALANSVTMGLQVRQGLSWGAAIAVVLVIGFGVGLINGVLVTYLRIDSFIATLGSGTVLYGVANWYTHGEQIISIEGFSGAFTGLAGDWFGIPIITYVTLVVAVILWVVFEYLPTGRYFYAVGANPRAAALSGIDTRRRIILSFGLCALFASATGAFLAAQHQVGQATTGPDFLLPAFAAALLGATSVRPGRVNVWGTVIAVLLLATAVAGLQQLGAQFYVEYLFNGAMVIIAVGAAGFVIRRRVASEGSRARPPDPVPPQPLVDVQPSPTEAGQ